MSPPRYRMVRLN